MYSNYQRPTQPPPKQSQKQAPKQTPKRPTAQPKRPTPYPPKAPATSYFEPEQDVVKPAIVFALICLLLPPVGIVCAWRSRRMTLPLRLILSGVGFASMTLIFFLLMRPDVQVSTIRPTPATPVTAGYNAVLVQQTPPQEEVVIPQEGIPAQPNAAAPADSYTEPLIQDSGEMTDDSIVYAVTNNASSYHRYEICDFQQNNRPLTLRDAVNEGLVPCAKCISAAE